ncbi:terminase [Bacillus atrophaeus]|uniref:pyocin knob domain-containing protein n=1 Tax=Bacillus atrophaeus TaxID=1452 RepID=UPI000D05F0C7|nr:pyocin knob domain-containing protein [Bacillus atrophaeus]PSA96449.1 terminase [Bacillus atrophaeus]
MAYEEKTDWLPDDPINEDDVNRWEKGIKDAHTDLAAHKNDMNNPHNTTKAQIGLGNVDDVQQAAKKDFDQHDQDQDRHITKDEREKWDGGQLSKFTKDNGAVLLNISNGLDFHKVAVSQYKTFTFYTANSGINTPPQSTRGIYLHSSSTYGEALALANDGGIWRKSLADGNWSDWIRFETGKSVQEKVEAHANKTDIHVTKADKDKWNGSQLAKLTQDSGLLINKSGVDFNIVTETGFYYMTSTSTALNAPVNSNGYLFVYSYGTYPYQEFTSYSGVIDSIPNTRRKFIRNKVSGQDKWTPWIEVEYSEGAQQKADKALSAAKDYVDSNFTNEMLTCLPDEKAILDARTPGTEYPLGVTLWSIFQNNDTGYPLGYGLIKNEKLNEYRFTQYFYGNADERNGKKYQTGTWVRHWWTGSGWTPWDKISGFAHAKITTKSRQALDKGNYNKINYNSMISDSHNAFDTTSNRFIVPNDGMYFVGAGVYIDNVQTYSNFELTIYLNGKQHKNIAQYRHKPQDPSTSKDFGVGVYGAGTLSLKKGDYLEIYMYVGYDDITRYVSDKSEAYNYFEILEMGGIDPRM